MVDSKNRKIELIEANPREHAKIFDNLLNLYFYDFAEILRYDIGADGSYLDAPYSWGDQGETVYLLYVDTLPSGFAIIGLGSRIDDRPDVWDMHEFFVIRRHRRSGLGSWLATEIWRKHPGTWDVRVVKPNTGALSFWTGTVNAAARRNISPKPYTYADSGNEIFYFRFDTA
ncbi:MAG: GNAT family N-acetyltransferase [Gammaproteobacteria bacterium]|jgi:predicted acetyltransferase